MLPGVGRLAVEDIMAERAATELLADQGVFHAVEAQSRPTPWGDAAPTAPSS